MFSHFHELPGSKVGNACLFNEGELFLILANDNFPFSAINLS